jgi:subtilisin family serine protease
MLIIFCFNHTAFAQVVNWQNLDLEKDAVFGISTEKAYSELLKGKKPQHVIVAIVDGGIDTNQEDLKTVIWIDPKTGGHGWNYIDAETGREDVTNLTNRKKKLYDTLTYVEVPENSMAEFTVHNLVAPALESKIATMQDLVTEFDTIQIMVKSILAKINKQNPTFSDFYNYKAKGKNEAELIKRIIKRLPLYPDWKSYQFSEITDIRDKAVYHLAHGLNPENAEKDTATGDADVSPDKLGPLQDPNLGSYHGTHVAGIIGAVRNNGIGMNGIADDVKIMMLKTIGNLRELRDKSLALSIRFAVDHGAKIINMSFGKPYTWDKKDVDDAVKYAMKKDVLLIHAAANDGKDIDHEPHYPNSVFIGKQKRAGAWIEVGASGFKNDSTLAASFSNYGKKDVDVFAPGVAIYSTLPYNQYASWQGTSMATPVVAGLAALIREYYPKLTAIQVKDIIMKSVVKVNHDVIVNGEKVPFSDLCVSGGIVNAYNALLLAEHYN